MIPLSTLLKLKIKEVDLSLGTGNVILKDEGNGPEIAEWKYLGAEKPTKENLLMWEKELDLQYRQLCAVQQRVYPAITDQLDMLYHDSMDGTTVWKDTITSIKKQFPKPLK